LGLPPTIKIRKTDKEIKMPSIVSQLKKAEAALADVQESDGLTPEQYMDVDDALDIVRNIIDEMER
jgi:hypothetical protein